MALIEYIYKGMFLNASIVRTHENVDIDIFILSRNVESP